MNVWNVDPISGPSVMGDPHAEAIDGVPADVWPVTSHREVALNTLLREVAAPVSAQMIVPPMRHRRRADPFGVRVRRFFDSSMGQGFLVAVIIVSGIVGALVIVWWLS